MLRAHEYTRAVLLVRVWLRGAFVPRSVTTGYSRRSIRRDRPNGDPSIAGAEVLQHGVLDEAPFGPLVTAQHHHQLAELALDHGQARVGKARQRPRERAQDLGVLPFELGGASAELWAWGEDLGHVPALLLRREVARQHRLQRFEVLPHEDTRAGMVDPAAIAVEEPVEPIEVGEDLVVLLFDRSCGRHVHTLSTGRRSVAAALAHAELAAQRQS